MDSLTQVLSQNAGAALLLQFAFIIILGVALVAQGRRAKRADRRWRGLLEGTRGDNLERLLEHHLVEKMSLDERTSSLEAKTQRLEAELAVSKRHVGLVRFDAFDDVGGEQSFAVAFLDDSGDGAVVSSLIGRTDCRVYCKPVSKGESPKNMTKEEVEAIRAARGRL